MDRGSGWDTNPLAARAFSEQDVRDSIELRGTLEGLAARLAADPQLGPQLNIHQADALRFDFAALAAQLQLAHGRLLWSRQQPQRAQALLESSLRNS